MVASGEGGSTPWNQDLRVARVPHRGFGFARLVGRWCGSSTAIPFSASAQGVGRDEVVARSRSSGSQEPKHLASVNVSAATLMTGEVGFGIGGEGRAAADLFASARYPFGRTSALE